LDELAFGMANELIEKPENKIAKKAECLHDCRWLMVGRGGDAVVAVEVGEAQNTCSGLWPNYDGRQTLLVFCAH